MDNLSEINCRVSDPLKIIEDNYFKTWIEKYICGSRWITVTWISVALVFWKLKLRNKNSALVCHFSSAKRAIMGSGRTFVGNFCRHESSRKCFGGGWLSNSHLVQRGCAWLPSLLPPVLQGFCFSQRNKFSSDQPGEKLLCFLPR